VLRKILGDAVIVIMLFVLHSSSTTNYISIS